MTRLCYTGLVQINLSAEKTVLRIRSHSMKLKDQPKT